MQTLLRGLPVYIADVAEDEETGIRCISLVDAPAVESDFLAFAKKRAPMAYRVADEDRHLLLGVVMRANYPIYRSDADGEYWIMYRPEAIRRMAEKYLASGRTSAVNIQHVDGSDVEGVDMVQWFLKDTARGIVPAGFGDIEDGSLFAEFHVTNEAVWSAVKAGEFKGFSLEGVFTITPSEAIPSDEKVSGDTLAWIERERHSLNYNDMKVLEKVREALAAIATVKMGSATTLQGVIYWDGDAELAVGDAVYRDGEDGERVAAPDGDYTFEDGHVVTVAEGKVSEIGDVPEPEPAVEAEAEPVPDDAKDSPKLWEAIDDVKRRLDDMEDAIAAIADAVRTLAEKQGQSMGKPAHEEFRTTPAPRRGDEEENVAVAIGRALAGLR